MKEHKNTLWMYLLLVLIGTSCSDSKNTPEQDPVEPPTLTIDSETSLTVKDQAGQASIAFTVNGDWTLTSSQQWCTPSSTNGSKGKITVQLNIEANPAYDSRKAVITLRSRTTSGTVNLTQVQKDAILLAQNQYELSSSKSTLQFEVQSNVAFTTETDQTWIRKNTHSGRGLTATTLSFEIDANPAESPREGHIILTQGELKQTIAIHQSGEPLQEITLIHQLDEFCIPTLHGQLTHGHILWGDNEESAYAEGTKHTYASPTDHKVTLQSKGAESLTIPSLKGITEIDLSKF